MANTPFYFKRTATPGNIPNPDMQTFGEPILNYHDGVLFFKDSTGAGVHRIGNTPGFGTVIANGASLVAAIQGDILRISQGRNIKIDTDVATDNLIISVPGPSGNLDIEGCIMAVGCVQIKNSTMTLPMTGNISIGTTSQYGRVSLQSLDSLGVRSRYGLDLSTVSRIETIPVAAVAAPTVIGQAALSATGTNRLRALSANSYLFGQKRTGYQSASVAGSAGGARQATALFTLGNTSTRGGFYFTQTFGVWEVPRGANSILFAGLSATTGALSATTNASTLASCVGFGCDRSNSTISFISNNATGPANTLNLGGNFPVSNGAVYSMKLYSPPQKFLDANLYWSIERLDVEAYAEGVANVVALPANNLFLAWHLNITNGLVAQNASVDLIRQYAELF